MRTLVFGCFALNAAIPSVWNAIRSSTIVGGKNRTEWRECRRRIPAARRTVVAGERPGARVTSRPQHSADDGETPPTTRTGPSFVAAAATRWVPISRDDDESFPR